MENPNQFKLHPFQDDGTGQVFVVAAQRASYWKSTVRHGRNYRPWSLPTTGTMNAFWKDMVCCILSML